MVREFVVSLENRPGTLAEFTQALGSANVNLTGIACVAAGEFGTVRFCTNNDATVESWLKSSGYKFRAIEVIPVKIPNKPGELARICQDLSRSGVNIEALYGWSGTQPGEVELCIQPDPAHIDSARKILTAR